MKTSILVIILGLLNLFYAYKWNKEQEDHLKTLIEYRDYVAEENKFMSDVVLPLVHDLDSIAKIKITP